MKISFVIKCIFVCLISFFNSCGGGTSGTSDPDTAFIRGVVISSATSLPVGNAEMYLVNNENTEDKIKSQTDVKGEFDMVGNGQDFSVELINVNYPTIPLRSSYSGYSSLGLTLKLNFTDRLTEKELIEASFRISKNCSKYFINQGNDITQSEKVEISDCNLNINSKLNSLSNTNGQVKVTCYQNATDDLTFNLDQDGKLVIPFLGLYELDCDSMKISVSNNDNRYYPAEIVLNRLR
jgi:hypothetical protein